MSAVDEAIAGELRLLQPEVRASPDLMAELLDPEFTEIGASGRFWTRSEIIAEVGAEPAGAPIRVSEMTGTLLAPGLVHLTYATDRGGRRARRSSLWRRTEDGWRVYFHQGTLTA